MERDEYFKKLGGPAFPSIVDESVQAPSFVYLGMTLRDYFAAKALPALIDKKEFDRFDLTVEEAKAIGEYAAQRAYAIADAMLRARGTA